jgi:hypothetical protein
MSIQLTVISEIEKIAAQHQKKLAPLNRDTVLMNSGLDSLCFAVLVARLGACLFNRGWKYFSMRSAVPWQGAVPW